MKDTIIWISFCIKNRINPFMLFVPDGYSDEWVEYWYNKKFNKPK